MNLKYISIVIILAIVVGGGILIYSQWPKEEPFPVYYGTIEGSLSYPSEFIPSDMKVCAENIATKKLYCTDKHIKDSKYTYGEGYKLNVPAGNYYVFATTQIMKDYKAYYSEFITCGLNSDCPSHEPTIVPVERGQTITGIDPQDWYKAPEDKI